LSDEKKLSVAEIVPDIAGATHAARDAERGEQPLERLTGVLAAAIRMMEQVVALVAAVVPALRATRIDPNSALRLD
jgi:hypothetical protein